jgi:hypothetical protein
MRERARRYPINAWCFSESNEIPSLKSRFSFYMTTIQNENLLQQAR